MAVIACIAALFALSALLPLTLVGMALQRWFWPAQAQALEEDGTLGEVATLLELATASRPIQ